MIFVSMVIEAEPEESTGLAEAMSTMMEKTRAEPGCITYTYARDIAAPNRFHLTEIWQSEALMDQHIDASHSSEFVSVLNVSARIVSVKAFAGDAEKFRIRAPAPRS